MRLAVSVMVLVVVFGCSTALPCTTCPPIDGTYAVTWKDDAGTPNAQCPGPRVATWALAQRGTQVTSTIGDLTLGGTLYDSYDLLMSASSVAVSYRLKALVIPEGTSLDAGVRLEGTFTTSQPSGDGGVPCESAETFTAQRTSR